MATLQIRVVAPDRVVYEGECSSIVAPAWDGQIGFLPGHAPMITLLGVGPVHIDLPGGGSYLFHVAGGVVKVEDNSVTVLSEYCGETPPEFIPEGVHIEKEDLLEHASAGNIFA